MVDEFTVELKAFPPQNNAGQGAGGSTLNCARIQFSYFLKR